MKRRLIRVVTALALFAAGMIVGDRIAYVQAVLSIASYLLVGYDVLLRAGRNIIKGMVFDENFLMTLATLGAFALGEFAEACAVMVFYQVGELFQDYAVNQSRKSISSLMDIRPDTAFVRREGEIVEVDAYDMKPGDMIVVRAGDRIPLDGIVTEGVSSLDTSALTGESLPRDVGPGDSILSGCINLSGMLEVEVIREFGESTASKVLDLVENASAKKSHSENFITRFARYYTPAVVIAAALLAFVPPLILTGASFREWISRALIFLVVSCPCALVISIPLSFFGGIGGASRRGILVKGSNYLDALAKTQTVVFDKTGTLTKGVFQVKSIHPVEIDENELLRLAAYAESYSNHPISQSLKTAWGGEIDTTAVTEVEEISGHGVAARVNGTAVLAGNLRLMAKYGITGQENVDGTCVHIAADGQYKGYILIADLVKEDSAQAIAGLKAAGVRQTVMLTGDADAVGQEIASQLGLDKAYTQLLPADKVTMVEELLTEKPAKSTLAYVGDGINDAPVLARADVGIAMGGLGSDAAIEAADIVIMTDEPSKVSTAISIARKTVGIANQNIVFALGVKALVLVLATFGLSGMWQAIFADVGVSVIAILNALRALNTTKL